VEKFNWLFFRTPLIDPPLRTGCVGYGPVHRADARLAEHRPTESPLVDGPTGQPLTAVGILRRFNSPGGVAHPMAEAAWI